MEQYIPKSTLAAEIERRKSQFMSQADSFHKLGMEERRNHFAILASNMQSLLSFIDSLQKESELANSAKSSKDLQEEPVIENVVIQKRRCLEEISSTINPFIDEVIEQFHLRDNNIISKEIQYRGIGLKGDFGENIHRSDDEVIYILKDDKTVGLVLVRRTEFNNAEITMVKTEERKFKVIKSND